MQKIIVHLDFSMKFGFVVILILKSRSAVSPSCQNEVRILYLNLKISKIVKFSAIAETDFSHSLKHALDNSWGETVSFF